MLGIVTVQWNSSQHTIRLIDSVSACLGKNIRLIIVDNGSGASQLAALKDKITTARSESADPEDGLITLIENAHNSGFARANNIAIKFCLDQDHNWIWLLNNDTWQTQNNLSNLSQRLANCEAGLYGTIIREKDKADIAGGYQFNKWTSRYKAIENVDKRLSNDPLSYISGASMLMHHSVPQQIGLLNESTFLYFEELDYCIRARQSGIKIGVLADVSVDHIAAGSASDASLKNLKTYHETWSTLQFYATHQKALFPLMLIARTLIKLMRLILASRRQELSTVLKATTDFMSARNKDRVPVEVTRVSHYR